MLTQKKPYLGFGLGLRTEYYEALLTPNSSVDWLEILTENYLVPGGKPLYYLDKFCERYPLVMHGVSLSIGSNDELDFAYLKQLKNLATRIKPAWISDHLCWTGVEGLNMHDLLPLPYTEEALQHVVRRIQQVQDYLGQHILLENVSSYLTYQQSAMTEWEFISEIAKQADCFILLDVNNVYVSSVNHEFDPKQYLDNIPCERVYQIHLAGHSRYKNYIIDTHDDAIIQSVWDLYAYTIKRFGLVSTLIERDDNFPEFNGLTTELDKARHIAQSIVGEANVA